MTGEVIKSFLIGLGWDVDDSSLAKFNQAVASATLKVAALYGSIKITAAAVGLGLSKISESFEQLGYDYKILAPAINKALILRRELLRAYSAAGINIQKTVVEAVKLNISLTKTKFALEALYKSVGSRFFGLLTKQSDQFRKKLYENLPNIQNALEGVIQFIFRAYEATVELGSRLGTILYHIYEFFVQLDKSTHGWSTAILGVLAAWKLLNLGFLATPFGLILSGLTALLLLWDDFKTFKEGGKALIDWGSETAKVMVGVATAIASVAVAIGAVIVAMRAYAAVQALVNGLLLINPFGAILIAVTALAAGIVYLDQKWKIFGGTVSGFFSGVGDKVLKLLGGTSPNTNAGGGVGPNIASNISGLNGNTGTPAVNPVGSAVTHNAQTNQNVHQQTNIHVTGSADAQSVGKQVTNEQNMVNYNLTRNLREITR